MESFKAATAVESKLHFLDYWRIIRIRKAIIVTVFLITAIIATAVTFILPEYYASTARIVVETGIRDIEPFGDERSAANSPYDPYFLQTTFEIIQSQVVLSNVIATMDLNTAWGKTYANGQTLKTSDTMEILKQHISLNTIRNTKYITITVYSDDKNEAAKLANAIAESYKNYRLGLEQERTKGAIAVLEKEYEEGETNIQNQQSIVDNLRKDLQITGPENPDGSGQAASVTAEQYAHYQDQKIEAEKTYQGELKELEELQSLQSSTPDQLRAVIPVLNPDTTLSGLLDKYNEAKQQYEVLKVDVNPTNNVNAARIKSEIDELDSEINERVKGIMVALDTRVKSDKAQLEVLTTTMAAALTNDQASVIKSMPYWDAKRKLSSMLDLHKVLGAKVDQQRMNISIPTTQAVTVTDPAEPSKTPAKPNKTLNIILGLVFGLVMGVGLAFFIEYLDTSVKTIDDVERIFQAPVLGVIPQNVGYLIDEGPESKYAEAYRVLRTNILFSRKNDQSNTVVVVSAGAGEGKSTTTLNLATIFAQAGSRVLVVDSDLRRPTLHKHMRVPNNLGLTNYLLKQNTLPEVVQTTAVPTLHFMPSGKLPNSSLGILGSGPMKEMIAELKQRYDFIFFDSPPILGVSDASVLASEVDLVIQVIQYRRYPQPMNIRAKQMIEKVGGNFVGIVLNNINMSQDESYYYYSGYYHDYYYTRTEDEQEAAAAKPPETGVADSEIKQKY
jgi:capsular exopolysaccharide synthesis family protein